MVRRSIILITAIAAIGFAGCSEHKEGPVEKAGERFDEIVDNTREGKNPLHKKGTMEKAGEDIDEALGNDKN